MVVQFIFFLNSENLVCRGTDISKYFRESLELRDNESQLYEILLASVSFTRTQNVASGMLPLLMQTHTLFRSAVMHHKHTLMQIL